MGNETRQISMKKLLLCMAVTLVLVVGITFGITLSFFGDSKSDSADITLGASIYLDETNGVAVSAKNSATVVPSQTVDVETSLKIFAGQGTVTKGVLKIIPFLNAGSSGASCTFIEGTTYDVTIGGSVSNDAVLVVYQNDLYLAKKSDSTMLYEITPSTSGLNISFIVPVTFPNNLGNSASGQTCEIEMTAVVIQSTIYTNANQIESLKISTFRHYFGEVVASTMSTNEVSFSLNSEGNGAVANGVSSSFNDSKIILPTTTTIDGVQYPVVGIADNAFASQQSITRVVVPNSVTSIGESSFNGCQNLIAVNAPNVTTLGTNAFRSCVKLTTLNLDYENIVSLPNFAFFGCNNIEFGDLELPNCEEIGMGAFASCHRLISIDLPKLTTINMGVFMMANNSAEQGKSNLVSVNAPNVNSIANFAFAYANNLKTVTLAWNQITNVSNFAFSLCNELELDTAVMTNMQYIGYCAFQHCYNLTIGLNEGLLWIGDLAFNHCQYSTQTSITIPSTVKQIGGQSYVASSTEINNGVIGTHVFYNCATTTLSQFIVASGNTNFVTDNGVLYTKNYKYLVAYPSAKTDASYTIHSGCENLFELSFSRAFNLKSLTISDELTISNTLPSNFVNSGSTLLAGIYNFTNIENFYVNSTNTKYQSIDGILYSKDGTQLVAVPTCKAKGGTLTLSSSCTTINIIAFSYYTSGDGSVTLDNNVTVGGRPNKIIIGSSVVEISDTVLSYLNSEGICIFEVDANNTIFDTENGKLIKK